MAKGGARPNAGRKKKVDEEKANHLFCRALKELYNKDVDDDAKVEFIKDLLSNTRGQIFIAEHVFGKPEIKQDITTDGKSLESPIIKFIGLDDNSK